jgi:hypothetical protein
MNLDALQGTFAVTDNPGIDTFDPRWSDVTGLVQAGQFAEAAHKADELVRQGVYDVRLIGYLVFGHFLDEGPAGLPALFDALASVLNGNWEAIGPAAQRAKATQQSLSWLFKQMLKQLGRDENTKSDVWQRWVRDTTAEQVDEALAQAFLLQQAIEQRLANAAPAVLELLGKVQAWLRSFQSALVPAATEPPVGEAAASTSAPAAQANGEAAAATAPAAAVDAPPIAGSYHLQLLMRKIDVFAALLEKQKLPAARIVADDISEVIASFDPLLYFPKLFSRFSRLMAVHAAAMAELEMDREAPPVKALQSLYRVDLDEFLKLE